MKWTVFDVCMMAIYAALFVVFDYASNLFFQMPNGGSIGLGAVPILLASYHLGWQKGLIVGIISVPLQFMTGPMYFLHWLQFLLDYTLAFAAYGLAVLFPNVKIKGVPIYIGVLISNLVRLACSTLSGIIFYGAAGASFMATFLFSINYNAVYMIPTCIINMILVALLHARMKPMIARTKTKLS